MVVGSTCPRSQPCPTCTAAPGEPCRRPSGHRADVLHAARIQLAESYDRDAEQTHGLPMAPGGSDAAIVRASLFDDPAVSNADYGRMVEEAAQADDARTLDAEREPFEQRGDAAPELIGTERGLTSDEHDGQPRSTRAIPETFMETHYLALDGCRVGLSRIDSAGGADQERQLCVHVSTDDGRTDDHTPEGLPYICITLGDATLYDHEPGNDRPTSTIDPTQVRYQLHGRPERLMIDAADAIGRVQRMKTETVAGLTDDPGEVWAARAVLDAVADVLQILAHGGEPEQGKPVQS